MQPEPPSDLLARARSGDGAAVSALLALYEPPLLRMVELRFDGGLRSRLEPADVVQETLVHALRRFPEWAVQTTYPLYVWLRLLAAQTLAEAHRRHVGAQKRDARRDVRLRARGPSPNSASVAEHLIASQTSPSEAARRAELCGRVRAALEELDDVDREVLVLRHFEGLRNEEVALELGIEPAAASKRYVRALQRLRPTLAALGGETGA